MTDDETSIFDVVSELPGGPGRNQQTNNKKNDAEKNGPETRKHNAVIGTAKFTGSRRAGKNRPGSFNKFEMMPGRWWGPVFRLHQTTQHFRLEAVDSLCAHRGDGEVAHGWQKGIVR